MTDYTSGLGSFNHRLFLPDDQLASLAYPRQKGSGNFPSRQRNFLPPSDFFSPPLPPPLSLDPWEHRDFYGLDPPPSPSMTGVFTGNAPFQVAPPSTDKRFKSLPPAEALPRSETMGGYIFVCNNDTMEENLKRQLFGLPRRYQDSVRTIQPGLPLFLYNYTSHQLHGIFEATSFGGSNIDPLAWEDKKTPGESRFPAQVRTRVRKRCRALDEVDFRPVLHHYDGPKFRLQLSVPEVLALLDLFNERDGPETPPQHDSPPHSAQWEKPPSSVG